MALARRDARLGTVPGSRRAGLACRSRCSVILLDLAIYLQHVLFHAVPVLWRLHRMHHADLEFDVTTGVRFHPIEILLSMGIKLGVVAALGTPAVAVLVFEVLLNATSMFNHGNVASAGAARPRAALDRGHAGHAPRAPLDRAARDQQQFRLQPAVVGSAVRHLPRPAGSRPRRHDHRHRAVPRSARAAARPHADCSRSATTTAATRSAGGSRPNDSARRLPRVLLGLVIAGGGALARRSIGIASIPRCSRAAVRDLGLWAPLAHIALFALGTMLFVPGALFGLAGGALFGPLWGTAPQSRRRDAGRDRGLPRRTLPCGGLGETQGRRRDWSG